ncbi:unnamed protein product [Dracunculus medinensis]|uniref:Sushi domain-containing protein n=1 Tax=Dracunculus medinensis TaxID=318479 RepID=A0A0N4UNP7_DRAME|nr:unnamed protein product [Dracunculus medinensis]
MFTFNQFLQTLLFFTWFPIIKGQCGEYPDFNNGKALYIPTNFSKQFVVGTIVTQICQTGYLPNLPYISICQRDGEWSTTLGKCVALFGKPCSAIKNNSLNIIYIPAGMNSEYVAGTLAIALCPFGTIIQGPVTSLCADGQWSTTFANCKASF